MDSYDAELKSVEELLALDPTNADLLQMKEDLLQMIHMQDRLQDLRKAEVYTVDDDEGEENDDVIFVGTNNSADSNVIEISDDEDDEEEYYSDSDYSEDQEQDNLDEKNSAITSPPKVFVQATTNDSEPVSAPVQPVVVSEIASWEKYTKGFGSKILEKFGYKKGSGLGLRKTGIAVPLDIADEADSAVRFGLGHSARTVIAQARKKKLAPVDPSTEQARKGRRKRKADEITKSPGEEKAGGKRQTKSTIFDFMNKALNSNNTSVSGGQRHPFSYKGMSREELEKQLQQRMKEYKQAFKESQQIEVAITRNKFNPLLVEKLEKQLEQLKAFMERLVEEQKQIKTRIDLKGPSHKKLKLF